MAFKAAGSPTTLFREHILLNPGSFATSNSTDDWRQEAHGLATPTRNLARDATAYGTEPLEDSWLARAMWGWSPSNTKSDGQAGPLA